MQSNELKERIERSLQNQTLHRIILSRPSTKGAEVAKVSIRPLHSKGGLFYQLTNHYKQKVTHTNCPPHELLKILWPLIGASFREAVFFTADADLYVLVNKRLEWTVLNKKPTSKLVVQEHNRLKEYVLGEGEAVPFLVELGVMRADGTPVPKMAHKFRQINRFVEIVADIIPHLESDRPLNIVDFGCGKSYLTFAIYHYLCNVLKRSVRIVGLDLKADVVANCQALADKLGYHSLHFQVGDINTHVPSGKIDLVVSLHACDTATDAALEKAVGWQADVILCVPCCQHELYNQVQNQALAPLLKHGILRERFAALATDAARAQLLEIAGYRTQVMEFIDAEHTPKNLLIRAVRTGVKRDLRAMVEGYRSFADLLGISPSLEARLSISG